MQENQANHKDFNWQTFRSELYLRHRGICWVCHEFIELQDYEIGHLIDRCNGGQDAMNNLAPMHKWCNNSKPRHTTLEAHITWLLDTKWIYEKPAPLSPNTMPTPATDAYHKNHVLKKALIAQQFGIEPKPKTPKHLPTNKQNAETKQETKVEPHPQLKPITTDNEIKLEALRFLSQIIGTPNKQPKELLDPSDIVKRFNARNHRQEPNTDLQQINPHPQVNMQEGKEIGLSYNHFRTGHYGYKHHQHSTQPKSPRSPEPTLPELLVRIVPNTICWMQGRLMGSSGGLLPIWRVLPPPYKQEDMFTMRETPPSAIDNGSSSPNDTIQIINGKLEQEIHLLIGRTNILISPDTNGNPSITFSRSSLSNSGERMQTVGLGIGQIPLREWYQAKAQGITFQDFVANYRTPRAQASRGEYHS